MMGSRSADRQQPLNYSRHTGRSIRRDGSPGPAMEDTRSLGGPTERVSIPVAAATKDSAARGQLGRLTANPWVRSVAHTVSTRFSLVAVGLASTVLLARVFGPTGRGVYAVAVTTGALLVVLGNLGYHAVNTYYGATEPHRIGQLVLNSAALAAAVTILLGGALLVVSRLWPDLLPLHGALAVLVVCYVPIGILFTQLQPLTLVIGRVRTFNLADSVNQLGLVLLIVLLWATGRLTPVAAYALNLLPLSAAVALIVWALRGAIARSSRPSPRLAQRTLPYALRSYFTTVALLLLLKVDILLVQAMLGAREVGYYTVAATAGEVAQILPVTIGFLLFPRLSSVPEPVERWRVLKRVLAVTAVLMAGVCLAVAVIAPLGVRVIYGDAFLPSLPAVYWLLPGYFFLGMNAVLLNYFLAVRMPTRVLLFQAAAVTLNVVLDVVLLRSHGIAAASVASSLAYGFLFVTMGTYALNRRPLAG